MRAALVLVVVGTAVLGPLGGAARAQHARARYVVAPGDTLTAIAKRYGVSMPRLARANGLNWDRPLLVGTKLHIPGTHAASIAPPSGWKSTYVVQAGDTLGAIAARYGVSLPKFARANGIDWQRPLLVGTKLHIPGTPAAPKSKPSGWTSTYVVQAGDTLSTIATRYGVSLSDIAGANKIDPAGVLLAGQKLHVPASAPKPTGSRSPSSPATRSQASRDATALADHARRSEPHRRQCPAACRPASGDSRPDRLRLGRSSRSRAPRRALRSGQCGPRRELSRLWARAGDRSVHGGRPQRRPAVHRESVLRHPVLGGR